MSKRLLDWDPLTHTATWHSYDPATDETTIGTEQNTDQVIELNKAIQGIDNYSRMGIEASWWHVASIPNILIEKWRREGKVDVLRASKDEEEWKKLRRTLMDPEYRYLRTGTGRL